MSETKPARAPLEHHPEARPYREAAARGKLLVPRCRACGKAHWYPRPLCPFCWSDQLDLQEASGEGVIYSYSVLRSAAPYALAYVTLPEGPTMMTRIVDCDLGGIRIGQQVRVAFRVDDEGISYPVFTPV